MESKSAYLDMPPFYPCRMCDKKMPTDRDPNVDIYFVRDSKGWFGREFECRNCYTSRKLKPLESRDSYRKKLY